MKILPRGAIESLERDGYLPGVPVLTSAEVSRARAALERFEGAYPEHVKKLTSDSHAFCPWVVDMASSPGMLDYFGDLYGDDLLLRNVAWRIKANDGETFAGWHQDHIYLGEMEPRLMLGILALSDCTAEQGCLRVVPGSHKWETLPHQDFDDPTSLLARGQQISADFDKSNIVDLVLRPGEMALIDTRVVHGSAPNLSNDRRLMVLVSMLATSAYRSDGGRETAMLIRGRDAHGNFDPVPRPEAECTEEGFRHWKRAASLRGKQIFQGSALKPSEGYGGDRASA